MNDLAQLNTSRPSELGVGAQHFDGEGNFVHDALTGRLHLDPKFKISWSIVEAIAVLVMHIFVFAQWTAQRLLHEYAVLVSFASSAQMQTSVSGRMDVPGLVYRAPFSSFSPALNRAEPLLHVVASVSAVLGAAKVTFARLSAKLTLEHWRGAAVHAASLALPIALVKEIV